MTTAARNEQGLSGSAVAALHAHHAAARLAVLMQAQVGRRQG
jgi:hypothetical protein